MNKNYRRILFIVLMVAPLLAASVVAQETATLPAMADLNTGEWTMIEAGGDTICSNGTPYSFFARPAAEPTSNLLIHFQGGGACWFYGNCDLASNPTYDPFVDDSDNPTGYDGIFNFENEENPFLDYNMVMVPYCTADVHIGNSATTYTSDAGDKEVTIQHNGFVNATTVLDWTFASFESPETVFVTGCSAGSIPSPFYTAFVAEAYPDARVEQLGDASGGYRNPGLGAIVFEPWGTMDILTEAYADITIDEMSFEHFYAVTGNLFPDISFTQYNTNGDSVQVGFLALTGVTTPFDGLLSANLDDIEVATDNFSSYTAGGEGHCITPTADFYTYTVGDVRFRDWVAALAAGEAVDDVKCEDCSEAELYEGM